MELISQIMLIVIMLCGMLMMVSSIFTARFGGRIFRLAGGILLFLLCALVFADPLLAMLSRLAGFVVTWVIRIGAVALGLGLLYLIFRAFSRR